MSDTASEPKHLLALPVVELAQALLGWTIAGRDSTSGLIVETEAYHQDEAACHAHSGRRTPRTEALFGPPGTWYVYFTYGMHHCCNVVAESDGVGAAVLIRACRPQGGIESIRTRRSGQPDRLLLAGPGRLTVGLGIGPEDNGKSCVGSRTPRLIPPGEYDRPRQIIAGPRVGISKAKELPWRFGLVGERAWFSRPFSE